jgi:hypothetical protein
VEPFSGRRGDLDDELLALLAVFGTVTETGATHTGAALKLVLINPVVGGIELIGKSMALADQLGAPVRYPASPAGRVLPTRRDALGDRLQHGTVRQRGGQMQQRRTFPAQARCRRPGYRTKHPLLPHTGS